jgi:ATP-dependent Zn protease
VIPPLLDATISESFSQNFSVATDPGITTATCTLSYADFYGDTSNQDVTSTNTSDTPAIISYTEETKEVLVAGLVAEDSRILTIDYVRERDNTTFTFFNSFITMVPFLIGIALIWMLVRSIF